MIIDQIFGLILILALIIQAFLAMAFISSSHVSIYHAVVRGFLRGDKRLRKWVIINHGYVWSALLIPVIITAVLSLVNEYSHNRFLKMPNIMIYVWPIMIVFIALSYRWFYLRLRNK